MSIREVCDITGKVISGRSLDEFQENWKKHREALKEIKVQQQDKKKEPEKVKKELIKKVEPKKVEPKKAEPKKAEPKKVGSKKVEPKRIEKKKRVLKPILKKFKKK